jgi:hypothetical protein
MKNRHIANKLFAKYMKNEGVSKLRHAITCRYCLKKADIYNEELHAFICNSCDYRRWADEINSLIGF